MLTTLRALLVAVLLLVSVPAQGGVGVVPGTGAMTGQGCNSHCLLNVNAEPFPFIDKSPTGRAVTNSNSSQSNAQVKFGQYSIMADVSTDVLSVLDSPDWDYTSDFSQSMWYYYNFDNTGILYLINSYNSLNGCTIPLVAAETYTIQCYNGAAALINLPIGGVTGTRGTWMYVYFGRSGSTARWYFNGTYVAQDATAGGNISNNTIVRVVQTQFAGDVPNYRDAAVITSKGWVWTRSHTPPNRRW